MRINSDKCVFGAPSLTFLGHIISSEEISPLPEKVKALQDLQPHTSLCQLRHFLGLLNYYRRFIPHCADLLSPLSDLLCNRKKKNEQILLYDIQLKVFNEVKQKLATTSLLAHLVHRHPVFIGRWCIGHSCRCSFATVRATTATTSHLFFWDSWNRQNNVTARFAVNSWLCTWQWNTFGIH